MKDLKAALNSTLKPDITHCRTPYLNYTARACMYGNVKYERANYARPTGDGPHTTPTREDFERFRAYLRAGASHIFQVLDAMEAHQANDPQFLDVEGMKRAAFAVDTDVTPGAKVGASLLPHVSPACASLNMAITQAVACGLLPADPGPTWEARTQPATTIKAEYGVNWDKTPFPGEYGGQATVAPPVNYAKITTATAGTSADAPVFLGRAIDDYNHRSTNHTNTGVCRCPACRAVEGAV